MPFAAVNGQNIFFEDSGGSGPPVLLAHGYLMDLSMFDSQVAALAPELRVIRWDARGFGKSEWDGRPFSYWDLADDALGLLDHLGIERAVLGGMSQGGFLAMRAALKAPERVKALVLIATQAGVDGPETLAKYRQMLAGWLKMGAIDPLVEAIAALILGAREHWEPWVSDWRAMPREQIREPTLCLLDRDDLTDRVGAIQCPAIIVHGTADASIHLDRAEKLRELLPNVKDFVTVPGAGHAVNTTHPDGVNGPLLAFLRAFA